LKVEEEGAHQSEVEEAAAEEEAQADSYEPLYFALEMEAKSGCCGLQNHHIQVMQIRLDQSIPIGLARLCKR
jgi:hypothetical protein